MINFGKYRSRLTGEGAGTERNDVQGRCRLKAVQLFEVLKFRLEKTYEILKKVNIYLLAMLIIKPGLCTSFSAIRQRIRTLYAMHSHIHCA